MSAPWLLRFGIDSVVNILNKRMTQIMTDLINELMNYKGVCRTALATPGLLIRNEVYKGKCIDYHVMKTPRRITPIITTSVVKYP